MTLAQQMRTEGFKAQLEVRGLRLRLSPSNTYVSTLFDDGSATGGQFVTGDATRTIGQVAILRADLQSAGFASATVGDTFLDESNGTYRVTGVRDFPNDIAVRFDVEFSRAP